MLSHRNRVIVTKIILFYSLFYVFMKGVILFQGAWPIPNLVLMIPFLVLAAISWWQVKREQYSWVFVAVGVAVILLARIFETQFAYWIQQQLS